MKPVEEYRAIVKEWKEAIYGKPALAVRIGAKAVAAAPHIADYLLGRAESLCAGSYILTGEFGAAEGCIYRALGPLASFPEELSNLFRRWSTLKLALRGYREAEELISRALRLPTGDTTRGKNLLQKGTLEIGTGQYSAAAESLRDAVDLLDADKENCLVALHNLHVALGRDKDCIGTDMPKSVLPILRKHLHLADSEFLKTRFQWLRAIFNIHSGHLGRAKRSLLKIMDKITSPIEIARIHFDLAETYWRLTDYQRAAQALEETLNACRTIYGDDECTVIAKMIASLRSQSLTNKMGPWALWDQLSSGLGMNAFASENGRIFNFPGSRKRTRDGSCFHGT